MILCSACRGAVDVDDPDVVYAVELKESPTFLGSELVVGVGVYFHGKCFPRDVPGYLETPRRKVLRPETQRPDAVEPGRDVRISDAHPFPTGPETGGGIEAP
jgi:hypothetical protein